MNLKPCPFCRANIAKVVKSLAVSKTRYKYFIYHPQGSCILSGHRSPYYDTKEEAIDAWNYEKENDIK